MIYTGQRSSLFYYNDEKKFYRIGLQVEIFYYLRVSYTLTSLLPHYIISLN